MGTSCDGAGSGSYRMRTFLPWSWTSVMLSLEERDMVASLRRERVVVGGNGWGKEQGAAQLPASAACLRPVTSSAVPAMGDSSSMDDSFLKPHAHAGRFHLAVTWLESLPLPPSSKGTAPTTLAGWEMVEQWRVLITCIESQGQFERERLRVETAEWKKRGMLNHSKRTASC